jgi:mRNA interferase MazF
VKRGEIWTLAAGPDYSGKPRPVVIIQSDEFDAIASITFCPFTTNDTIAPLFRIPVQVTDGNGLRSPSNLMVDKIATVPKAKMGKRIGRIGDEDLVRLNRAILVFLGLATPPSRPAPEE